jgi:N-acetylneuraminic acid mutarotase
MALSSSEEYDPESDTWSGVSDMNQGRMFHTSTLLYDGRVLVTGGSAEPLIMDPWRDIFDARLGILGEGKTLASVEIFDPATGAWTTLQDMEIARKVHTATILPDGVVLIVGGTTLSGSATSSFELYDPASQTDTNDSTSIP